MANSSQTGEFRGGGASRNPFETGRNPYESGRTSPDAGTTSTRYSTSETEGSAAGAADSMGSMLKDSAKTATDAVRQQAAQFAEDVGHELSKTGEAQKQRGVEALRGVARAIDSAAGELEGQSPTVARTVRQAAQQVNGLSDSLANRDVNDLIDQATQFARAQPMLFIGGSVAAGFALARFLKSSSRQDGRMASHRMRDPFESMSDPYQS